MHIQRPQGAAGGRTFYLRNYNPTVVAHGDGLIKSAKIGTFVLTWSHG